MTISCRSIFCPAVLCAFLVVLLGTASQAQTVTVNAAPVRTNIKRLGINLSHPSYYDSAQMLKNMAWKTYGFEGNEVRVIVQCGTLAGNTCVDKNPWSSWASGFANGFTYEVLGGPAKGATGTVSSSTNDNRNAGQCGSIPCGANTFTVSGSPSSWGQSPYLALRGTKSGFLPNPTAEGPQGLWISGKLGANYAASTDTCPGVCGAQSLDANLGAGAGVTQTNYFDDSIGHMFVMMNGQYGGSFWAKLKSGNGDNAVNVHAFRSNGSSTITYFNQTFSIPGDNAWHKFTLSSVSINEIGLTPSKNNYAAVTFTVSAGSEVLLDNENWGPVNGNPANTSVFRDDVYNTLLSLKPGVLRYMDDDNNAGNSLDTLIAPDGQRKFSTFDVRGAGQGNGYVAYSLDEFLHLCALVGADPWFTIPATFTKADMVNLAEYLDGPSTSTYGAKRAALGQSTPWTSVFRTVHLELGNEMWNTSFASNMTDMSSGLVNGQAQYGQHADYLFAAMKTAPDWNASRIDLVKSGWNTNQVTGNPAQGGGAYWIAQQKSPGTETANHISEAPYLMSALSDCSSTDAVFQAAFAEGHLWDQPTANAGLECALGTAFSGSCSGAEIYEVNAGTNSSKCTQAQTTNITSSIGMAMAVGSHMLQMQRDEGIEVQNIFALPEYANGCGGSLYCPLWGVVVDMGGGTQSRLRPTGQVMKLINDAIGNNTTEITTTQSGLGTFSSAATSNDTLPAVSGIPLLESHAYTDGAGHYTEIFINKSMTEGIVFRPEGIAPTGKFNVEKITSAHSTDNNEVAGVVEFQKFTLGYPQRLLIPPFSMVSISW